MARLTPEEKAANREVFKARDHAFHARCKLHRTAREKELAVFEAGPEEQAMKKASAAFDEAIARRSAAREELERQIAALQDRKAALDKEYCVAARAEVRRQAVDARNKARSVVEARVDGEYHDVAKVHSAVQWAGNGHFKPSV